MLNGMSFSARWRREARLAAEPAPTVKQPSFENASVTNASPSHEKVDLFRSLFAGRPDVFPLRWDNRKTGRSGYSPACANEWVKGICGKPKVKCGECLHQKFIPPDESVMEKHLRGGDGRSGDFVAGVYPLLSGDTCWFLAADFDKASWADDANALLETCRQRAFPQRWNDRDLEMAVISGSSSPNRSLPVWHASLDQF